MPKSPNGQIRPADAIGCAVMVAQIAVGEVEGKAVARNGVAGGKARASKLADGQRSDVDKKAASQRWS